jgi:hypothetical protein
MHFSLVLRSLSWSRFAPISTPIRFGVEGIKIRDETARSEIACSEIAR